MALLAVLLIVVALAGAATVVLVRRRTSPDAEAVAKALATAAERLAAGKAAQARRRYARLARQLATGPAELRPQRGLALLGQAEATIPTGDRQATLALHREAFPLLADPARQLPRWSLRQLAEERIRTADGDLAPSPDPATPLDPAAPRTPTDPLALAAPLAFLQATAAGAEPGEEADTAARTLDWLQRRCREGTPAQREETTARALAALPGRDWPVLARAALLRDTDRAAEAEALLAATAPGGSGELWFRWGAQLYTLHRDEPAVTAFDEALRRGPGEPSPWGRGPALRTDTLLFRGLARQRLGATEAAWGDLAAAAVETPTDPRPRYALGRLALLLGADDQARDQFTAALTVQPSFAPARFGLALVHERADRPAEAAADYRTGLDQAPHWRPARIRLGAALLAAGRPAEAEPVLRAEADTEPGTRWTTIAAFHHGLALARTDDPAGALARWEPLDDADLRERRALARDRLARTRLATDPAAARELWQQAAAEHPAAPGYRAALREAALREAAHLLVTGRDRPEQRHGATAALALADTLPGALTHRQARLRAALALADGTTEPVSTLLDATGGLRDRYHLAAVALLAGRPAQTIALLGPPDPAGDPATARLRALLAERAGNWAVALDWYRHFLSAGTAPRDDAPPAFGDCTGCDRPATGACGGCGREACTDHLYAPEGTASPRCIRCAGPALRAVLDCARRAGTPDQAEPVLAAWATVLGDGDGDGTAAAPVRLDLALLRAELGRHDEALADLPPDATALRAAVLVRRAGAALAADRPGQAAVDLRQALALTPDHPQAAGALVLLAEHEAHQHALDGRHREAWEAYRTLLRQDPAHPRLLHALGLAGYRLAAAAGAPDGPGTADEEVWAWTLGCLVAALYQPELWAETARTTGRTAEPQRLAAARAGLIDRLRDDLRALDRAAGRGGDEITAWTLRLGMEAHGADAFAQEDVRITLPGRPARRLTAGPTLDRLLRARPGAAESGQAEPGAAESGPTGWAEAFDRAVRPWRQSAPGPGAAPLTRALSLFGALGPQYYLQLQGRQAAAVAALDAVAENERGEAWQALLRDSLVAQAREHHRNQDWREALDCLTRARAVPGAVLPADAAAIAAESGVRAARALLKNSLDDQPGAAELLEKALALAPDDPEVRGDLGATYAQWARKINNEDKDYTRALDLLQKSLDLVPGDPTARHFLEAALGNRAGQLSHPEATDAELEEAADAWRALIALKPDPDNRLGLAFVLRHLARSAAFADDRVRAVERMAEALDADPEWEGDARREAPRRVAVMLANHVVDALQDKPFTTQAALLQKAKSYDDSDDIRRLMVSVWRGEAIGHYEARSYVQAIRLLEEALGLSRTPEDVAKLHRELGIVYGSYAVQSANARRLREARELARQAVEHSPEDAELRAMQRRINGLY
ncbi:hypothetical protein BX285_3506 [Streptomyces sp. 1114.5]|uniref:hypothetical protein n=1 Tax=unclassified Streptomyces TaxID=2593676 RepID=UPI000BCB509E|nr:MULTISPECIES: hypothetical protein [unclassified Streptomyces]RKT19061.1 hypothetical protein BX285_3506 [Streptomyces sp. 1114.5]SOB85266.1 hypothetical protein SAMN06272789_5542 [Streptomyces sp. 1331.2]